MTLKLLFTLNAIVAILFGLVFLLIPGTLLPIYGMGTDPSTINIARLLGGSVLGYGVISWLVRDSPDGPVVRSLVLGFFAGVVTSLLGAIIGQLGGQINSLGWTTVALYALFTLGYGYFAFMKPAGR